MNAYTVEQYKDAGCTLTDGRGFIPFTVLFSHANGKLCDTGCAYYGGGRCPNYKILTRTSLPSPMGKPLLPEETVRQQATRMGISLSEVRRLRNNT